MSLRVAVLGPLEVERDGELMTITGRKERALLATLAVRAGWVLTVDQLIDVLWAEEPPPSAHATLRSYVSRLRRVLGEALVSGAGGYALDLDGDAVDAKRFERLVSDGTSGGNPAALAEALNLWRGQPLADLRDSVRGQAEARRLTDLRLRAVAAYAEWRVGQGDARSVLGMLEREIADHPYQETLWAMLVRALYDAGRQADALSAYQRARELLVEDLGLEPGAELQAAEALVLAGDGRPVEARSQRREQVDTRFYVPHLDHPLIGRSQELERLIDAWHEARHARSGSVSVIGEPGIGKSRLLAELAAAVLAEGGVVLYGYGDATLPLPLGPLLTAVEPLVGPAMTTTSVELDALFGTGDAALLGRLEEGQRLRLHRQLTKLIADAASITPICLILDDLHCADESTVAALRHLVRLPPPHLTIVISSRPTEPPAPIVDLLDEMAGSADHRRIALGPVHEDAARRIVEHHLSDERAAPDIVDRAGGHPLLLVELARFHAPMSAHDVTEASSVVQAAVQRRLSRMPAEIVDLLRAAAVFGRQFELDGLAALCGQPIDELAVTLDTAVAGEVLVEADGLGRYHFSHVIVADALLARLGSNALAALHRRAADALTSLVSGPTDPMWVRAAHHLESGGGHDSTVFMAAARLAARRADHRSAIHWYEAGLAGSRAGDATRAELLIGLGESRDRILEPGARSAYLEAIEIAHDVGDDGLLVEAVLGLTRYNQARSVASLDEAVVAAIALARSRHDPDDHAVAARLAAAECAEVMWTAPGDHRQALRDQAVEEARLSDDPSLLGEIAALTYFSAGSARDVQARRATTDEALRAIEPEDGGESAVFARVAAAYTAFEMGDVDRADQLANEAEGLVQDNHHRALAWRVTTVRTALAMFHGELDEAQRLIDDVSSQSRSVGTPQDMLVARAMCQLGFERDDLEPLISLLDAIVAEPTVEGWRSAYAYLLASIGRSEDAAAELRDLVDALPRTPRSIGWLTHRCGEALAAATLGDGERARVLAEALLPFRDQICVDVIASMGPVSYATGWAWGVAGEVDLSRDLLEQAASISSRLRAPLWQARAESALTALA